MIKLFRTLNIHKKSKRGFIMKKILVKLFIFIPLILLSVYDNQLISMEKKNSVDYQGKKLKPVPSVVKDMAVKKS